MAENVSEACFDKYLLPKWFLSRNVRTFTEIGSPDTSHGAFNCSKKIDNPVPEPNGEDSLAGSTRDGRNMGDGSSTATSGALPDDVLSELRDVAGAALVTDQQGYFLNTCGSIVLRCVTKRAMPLIDEMLLCVARDLKATLVSVDMEDLEDLGWEFDHQDRERRATWANGAVELSQEESGRRNMFDGMATYYFGARSKRKAEPEAWDQSTRAIAAVFDGHITKSQRQDTPESENPPAVVSANIPETTIAQDTTFLLHIRNLNEMVLMENGHRFAKTLWNSVQHRRLVSKQRLVLLVSSFKTYENWRIQYPDEYGSVENIFSDTASSKIDIDPCAIPDTGSGKEDGFKGEANFRRLKRFLRHRIPHLLAPALARAVAVDHTFPIWTVQGYKGTYESMVAAKWTPEQFQRVASRIAGRGFLKGTICFDDVNDVLLRLELCKPGKENPELPESGEVSAEESGEVSAEESGSEEEKFEEAGSQTPTSVASSDNIESARGKSREEKTKSETMESVRDSALIKCENTLLSCVVDPDTLQTTFDDVIIDDDAKETVKFLVSLSEFKPEAKSAFLLKQLRATGILLYGPPGTGKTHLCRAIAKASGSSMLSIDAASVQSYWEGETEKYIKAAFSVATKRTPCVLFIDEVDSLFYRRSSRDSNSQRSSLAQFLSEMDGLTKQTDGAPFVIVATNRPQDLDEAFYRRLPHKIYFRLPDVAARVKILQLFLAEEDLHPQVHVGELAQRTEGYSGSDLGNLCAEAAMVWAMEEPKVTPQGEPRVGIRLCINASHFEKALRRIRPSVSQRALDEIAEFARRFNPDAVDGDDLAPELRSAVLNSRGGMDKPAGDAPASKLNWGAFLQDLPEVD